MALSSHSIRFSALGAPSLIWAARWRRRISRICPSCVDVSGRASAALIWIRLRFDLAGVEQRKAAASTRLRLLYPPLSMMSVGIVGRFPLGGLGLAKYRTRTGCCQSRTRLDGG